MSTVSVRLWLSVVTIVTALNFINISLSVDNSNFVYFNLFILALDWKYAITQFKFICAYWDLLKNKLTDSSQHPCWWRFEHNTKAETRSQICNTYCLSTAKLVASKRLYVRVHALCVCFLISVNFGVGRDRVDGVSTYNMWDGPTIEYMWGRYFPHHSKPTLEHTILSVQ